MTQGAVPAVKREGEGWGERETKWQGFTNTSASRLHRANKEAECCAGARRMLEKKKGESLFRRSSGDADVFCYSACRSVVVFGMSLA